MTPTNEPIGNLERKAARQFRVYSALNLFLEMLSILFLLPVVFGLLMLFNGGWNVEPTLELMAAFLGTFLISEYVTTQIGKKVFLRSSFRDKLKEASYMFLLMLGGFGGILILSRYFGFFPWTLHGNIKLEILKTVVQADGFLIGLAGVVYAQMFWSINHQQNSLQIEIFQHPQPPFVQASASDIRKTYVVALDKKRRDMTIKMSGSVSLLLISIALSLSAMANIDLSNMQKVQTFPDVTTPIFLMIGGVVLLVISIATLRLSLEESDHENTTTS